MNEDIMPIMKQTTNGQILYNSSTSSQEKKAEGNC